MTSLNVRLIVCLKGLRSIKNMATQKKVVWLNEKALNAIKEKNIKSGKIRLR